MTAIISKLKSKADVQQLPVTHERAVRDDNGTTLETKLQMIDSHYNKDYEVGNGMGKKTLPKNNGVLTQAMMPLDTGQNTIYVIQYDFNISGNSTTHNLTIPGTNTVTINGDTWYYTDVALSESKLLKILDHRCVILDSNNNIKNNRFIAYGQNSVRIACATANTYDNAYEIADCVIVPENSVLCFDGGSINGGIVAGNGCRIAGTPDIRCSLYDTAEGTVHLKWFTRESNKNLAFNRALDCGGLAVLDGDNEAIELSQTILFDEVRKCDLKNLNIIFTSSSDNQNMFLFNTTYRYTGNHGTISHCSFTLANPSVYKNVHCIHYRTWDSTVRGKIDDVWVVNFTGYMFICESYLQEFEFNRFKGSNCGGFISFNKEYGTNNTFGDWRAGSSNILRFIDCGMEEGYTDNSTITDIIDLTNSINTVFEGCVFQGAAKKVVTNIINISAATGYAATVNLEHFWMEFTYGSGGAMAPTYGVTAAAGTKLITNDRVRNFNITGNDVVIQVSAAAAMDSAAYGNMFTIAEGSYPKIKIVGECDDSNDILRNLLERYGSVASITVDLNSRARKAVPSFSIQYKRPIWDNNLPKLANTPFSEYPNPIPSNVQLSVVREFGIDILRVVSTGNGYHPIFASNFGSIITNSARLLGSKNFVFRVLFRLFPLVEVTESNKDNFTFSIVDSSSILRSNDTRPCGFVAGQSLNPSDAEWHEYIVNPYKATSSLIAKYGLSANTGIDYAVNMIYLDDATFDDGIIIDPTDNTKLINGKAGISDLAPIAGETSGRPTMVPVGYCYFDTTTGIEKPIWYKGGGTWVDATGATV